MGFRTVNRKDLRVGDEVVFYDKDCRIVGTVVKVNRKSIKVRQTNEDYRYTRQAFGSYGGRKKGGEGVLWTVGCQDDGTTNLYYTPDQQQRMKDTVRGIEARRRLQKEHLTNAASYAERAFNAGSLYEDILEAVVEKLDEARRLKAQREVLREGVINIEKVSTH